MIVGAQKDERLFTPNLLMFLIFEALQWIQLTFLGNMI